MGQINQICRECAKEQGWTMPGVATTYLGTCRDCMKTKRVSSTKDWDKPYEKKKKAIL